MVRSVCKQEEYDSDERQDLRWNCHVLGFTSKILRTIHPSTFKTTQISTDGLPKFRFAKNLGGT